MNTKEFIKIVAGKDFLTDSQLKVIEAIQAGEMKLVGVDYARPGGDKTSKIYGKYNEKTGQFIVDDIETY